MQEYEIEIVARPESDCLCLRARGSVGDLPERVSRLAVAARTAGLTPAGAIEARFYDVDHDPADCDLEVCLPVVAPAGGTLPDVVGDARGALTPAHHAMATTHRGPYRDIDAAHRAVRDELARLGYSIAGPATEVYVRGPADGAGVDDYLTVVCYPYAR